MLYYNVQVIILYLLMVLCNLIQIKTCHMGIFFFCLCPALYKLRKKDRYLVLGSEMMSNLLMDIERTTT